MSFTNININAIEETLPAAFLNIRNQLIEEALKRVNIWLTPNPNLIEYIYIIIYKDYNMEQKFPFDMIEQRKLLERMFDTDMSQVFINKTTQINTKNLFGQTRIEVVNSEERNFVFPRLSMDLKREIDYIKKMLSALKNPRVVLTVEEHNPLVGLLNKFNINLSDYYI